MSDAVLAARLRTLVGHGVLDAVPYREPGTRTRHEYRLTERGLELYPVMIALLNWGDAHRVGVEGPPLEVTHTGCGEPVRAVVRCADGHELASPREGRVRPGPGARAL